MAVKLNQKGYSHARKLIQAKDVNLNSSWSFSAEDGNKLLGENGDDWANYSKWFLGKDDEVDENTKAAWKYPFGKNGKVYRKALTAIRQRAGQQNADNIFEAAGKLLDMIDESVANAFIMNTSEIFIGGDVNVPRRIHIISTGHWVHPLYGEFDLTLDDLNQIVKNFKNMNRWLVTDYEHQTLKDVQAPAAGWIKNLEVIGEDLFAEVEWTKRAEEYIANKEYRYLSPVILFDQHDKKTGEPIGTVLHSVAITNSPFVDEIQPLAAKEYPFKTIHPEDLKMKELFEKLAQIFALKDISEPKEIVAAIENWKKDVEAKIQESETVAATLGKIRSALQLKEDAQPEEITQKVLALSDPGKFVSLEEFNKLKEQLHQKEVAEVIEQAKKEGKVVPANEEWAKTYALKDLEGFKKYLETAPVLVDMKNQYHQQTTTTDPNTFTEEDRQVAEMLGVELETQKD